MRRPSLNSSTLVIVILGLRDTPPGLLKELSESTVPDTLSRLVASVYFLVFSYTVMDPLQLRLCMPTQLLA
ncbi:MAG: hypothetical protein QOI53_392 [Verrucomicrobiota bacterium]|jgi:hypothetical protein|nr:hypothetical protein [Verrucomicrobiota bacterium]